MINTSTYDNWHAHIRRSCVQSEPSGVSIRIFILAELAVPVSVPKKKSGPSKSRSRSRKIFGPELQDLSSGPNRENDEISFFLLCLSCSKHVETLNFLVHQDISISKKQKQAFLLEN